MHNPYWSSTCHDLHISSSYWNWTPNQPFSHALRTALHTHTVVVRLRATILQQPINCGVWGGVPLTTWKYFTFKPSLASSRSFFRDDWPSSYCWTVGSWWLAHQRGCTIALWAGAVQFVEIQCRKKVLKRSDWKTGNVVSSDAQNDRNIFIRIIFVFGKILCRFDKCCDIITREVQTFSLFLNFYSHVHKEKFVIQNHLIAICCSQYCS